MRYMITSLFRKGSAPARGKVSEVTKSLFGPCKACDRPLDEHYHWKLASVILQSDSPTLERAKNLVDAGNWKEASEVREWRFDADVREYHFFKCPTTSRVYLAWALFRFDLGARDHLEGAKLLEEKDEKAALDLVGQEWVLL